MYAEVYFPSAGNMRVCVFNRFRSRRQYIYSWLQLSQQVLTELNKTGLPCHHWQYVTVRLQEAGKNFISENGRVVLHRNILVYRCGVAVGVAELDVQSRHILAAYLSVQYSAWVEMCSLCESFFQFTGEIIYGRGRKSNCLNCVMPFGCQSVYVLWLRKEQRNSISGGCSAFSIFPSPTIPATVSAKLV